MRLISRAETNPDPRAIVGMWHRNAWEDLAAFRTSVLFRPDGTGLASIYSHDGSGGSEDDVTTPFTWTYQGGGVWKTKAPSSWEFSMGSWRIAEGKLLRNAGVGGVHGQVFERVAE
jgi:hypothetical protein